LDEELGFRTKISGQAVGVKVSEQQHDLEEKETGGPHRRGAAEPRQYDFGDDQLDLEQQE
jgi:hypothetical protein